MVKQPSLYDTILFVIVNYVLFCYVKLKILKMIEVSTQKPYNGIKETFIDTHQ